MNLNPNSIPLLAKLDNYGQKGNKTPVRGVEIAERLRNYSNLVDLLPSHNAPAICEPSNSERSPLTHQRLKKFVKEEFDLTQYGIPHGQRVGLLLPNGPELALAVIATVSNWCAAPINPTNTWEEIKLELQSTKAMAVMVLSGAAVNEAAMKAAAELNLGVIALTPLGSITGVFRTALLQPVNSNFPLVPTLPQNTAAGYCTYSHPEIVLLLHTSGTSGNKKLVPYSLDMLVIGVGCIVASWNLTASDVCLNMMPLFHIGGIVRNVLSPVLSGGAVVACSGFDPLLFWDILYDTSSPETTIPPITWYYAAPTMHHAILTESERRPHPLPVQTIRYIANAAGGLLPVLANRLRDTFDAIILTSYGMTECMPISTPPQSYRLSPTGTSGTPVGPDVLIVGEDNTALPLGSKGNICVRGPPCFGGYENNGTANEESFVDVAGHGAGWFNTGDMGHVDEQGYLFISGRSKEIINRGGETISPFEIEEVIQQHPYVKETIAFSAPHEQYQETVGVIIVSKPNKPRVDLPSLHKFIESKLHRSKWPYLIVFSDGLPKNAAGKTLRIRFAERIGLKNVDEDSSPLTRLLEAICPPVGTPLHVPIGTYPVLVDYQKTRSFYLQYAASYGIKEIVTVLVDLPAQQDTLVAFVVIDPTQLASPKPLEVLFEELIAFGREKLDAYLVPQYIYDVPQIPTQKVPPSPGSRVKSSQDDAILRRQAIDRYNTTNIVAPRNAIESEIELIWRSQLGCASTVSVTSSFFELGGDSLKAGQIVGIMRDTLKVPLSVADLFTAPTIEKIAIKISKSKVMGSPQINHSKASSDSYQSRLSAPTTGFLRNETRKQIAAQYQKKLTTIEEEKQEELHREYMTWEFTPPLSNTSFGCLFIQALPIVLIYPLRRIIIWFLIAGPWVTLMEAGYGRFASLVCAMFIGRLLLGVFAPLVGIAAKWLIIGRYQAGKYPLWGAMYLKWWLVEQIVNIMGKGFFRDDLPIIGPYLVRWYYMLMGAKIGKNVKIHKEAKIGQADLLTIDDDVAIDNCTIRPFSIEEGHFVLLPIHIKKGSSVGVKSVISAGSTLPPHTALGPLSSSHEINDADPDYRQYCRPTFAQPPNSLILFVGIPVLVLVFMVSMIPWYIVLHIMVQQAKEAGWYASHLQTIYQVFLWWITPQRFKYFLLLRVVKRCLVPFIRLGMVILIKHTLIGKFTEMDAVQKAQPWNRFRYWLMAKLLPGGGLCGVAKLVGTHYECVSVIYRLLGAKIGKHVYWPGSGLEIIEYDLLEIGDDVVFGSRSVVMTSSSLSSKKVVLESGSMVADRCVLLPGVVVKKGAVLGSGALAAEDVVLPVGSVWLGSQEGCALNVAPADPSYAVKDTVSPFAKGFYLRQATFTVMPLWCVALYNTLWQAFCTCYRNSPTVLSLMLCSHLTQYDPFDYDEHSAWELLKMTYIAFAPLYLAMCGMALVVDIVGKWTLLGRRKAGEYPWDQSSYCQRWQVYLTLQEIRRGERHKTGILDMIQGSQYLVWYFRLLGATIGNNVCLYPNGGDPMMTEPDLVTIGDFVGIDDASLIAHINTRGVFRLNPLTVGTGCILKSMSRLLSGGNMEPHSILYEHTLVLSGETVKAGNVWQGWPSRAQFMISEHRETVKYLLNEVSLQARLEMRSYASTNTLFGQGNSNTTTATTTTTTANKSAGKVPGLRVTIQEEGSNGKKSKDDDKLEEGHGIVTPAKMHRSPAIGLQVRPELKQLVEANAKVQNGQKTSISTASFTSAIITTADQHTGPSTVSTLSSFFTPVKSKPNDNNNYEADEQAPLLKK